jgi:hypothetical protein
MNIGDLNNPEEARRAIENFKRRYAKKVCQAPDTASCSGPIIASHTLSVGAMLRPISRDSRVYTNSFRLHEMHPDGPLEIKLKGVHETSVFNGFCSHHDAQIFSPIENLPFSCSPEQVFLHAFRAVAKESFLKRSQLDTLPGHETIEKIHGLPAGSTTEFGELLDVMRGGIAVGALEIENLKSRMDKLYLASDWRRIATTIVPFSSMPTVVCNFVYAPDFDFNGRYLQPFEDKTRPLDHLMVTITPGATGGFALFSHLDDAGAAPRNLIKSLLSQPNLTTSIIWLVVGYAENTAFSPDWYESLTPELKTKLRDHFVSNADPLNIRVNVLKDCPHHIADWSPGAPFTI